MRRESLNDFLAFIAVAREQSFTKAAAKLGVSQSALSYTVRTLEGRLGVRLLTRTTRSVSLTEAGDRLLRSIGPRFDEIETEIAAISDWRDKPAGTIRITAVEHAAETYIWPAIAKLLPDYPDINVEIISDYALADIVTDRFDAGVRMGEHVDKDMISVAISPDLNLVTVASPDYLAANAVPVVPQDLTVHSCIGLRLPTNGGLYNWPFRKDGREIQVRVRGRAAFNTLPMMRNAALSGFGIGMMPLDYAVPDIDAGRLVQVLADWTPPRPGYHLYYPSRRQHSPAFALMLEALRHHR
jgi:DNA-binding transcriptional LysR family regulator